MKTIFQTGKIGYFFILSTSVLGVGIYLAISEKALWSYLFVLSLLLTNISIAIRVSKKMKE